MIVQSFRLRRPTDGPLFCTRGKHFAERSEFKLRTDGHPHSWCAKCKREYDNAKVAERRRAAMWQITDMPRQMGDAKSDYIGWMKTPGGVHIQVQIGFQCGSEERAAILMQQMAGVIPRD